MHHCVALHQILFDLTKTFYIVNRTTLWTIHGKLSCPPQFINMFMQLHCDMKVHVNFNVSFLKPISINNRVKQRNIPVPTLLAIYFTVSLICISKLWNRCLHSIKNCKEILWSCTLYYSQRLPRLLFRSCSTLTMQILLKEIYKCH